MLRNDPNFDAERLLKSEEYVPEELAELLDFDVNVIRRAIWNGEMEARRIGSENVAIPRSEVVRWMREHPIT